MAVLKKMKGSTLVETLVATVLIVIIFMVASLVLNQVFSNSIKNTTRNVEARLHELHYLQQHQELKLPYQERLGDWEIVLERYAENGASKLLIEAIHIETKKELSKTYYE